MASFVCCTVQMLTQMIPFEQLFKMGVHTIEIDWHRIKVSVVDRADVIDRHVEDMRNIVATSFPSVVGLDLKCHPSLPYYKFFPFMMPHYQILVVCVRDRCLIVQLEHLDYFPESLIGFLTDPNFCHVGIAINAANCRKLKPELFSSHCKYLTKAGVDVGELAAKVLAMPCLLSAPLAEIAREARVPIASQDDTELAAINLSAKLFSCNEVKIIATDAFRYYKIGHKLLSSR
ncbi:hypothetical protein Dimus_012135 [Dionaea muscipula]